MSDLDDLLDSLTDNPQTKETKQNDELDDVLDALNDMVDKKDSNTQKKEDDLDDLLDSLDDKPKPAPAQPKDDLDDLLNDLEDKPAPKAAPKPAPAQPKDDLDDLLNDLDDKPKAAPKPAPAQPKDDLDDLLNDLDDKPAPKPTPKVAPKPAPKPIQTHPVPLPAAAPVQKKDELDDLLDDLDDKPKAAPKPAPKAAPKPIQTHPVPLPAAAPVQKKDELDDLLDDLDEKPKAAPKPVAAPVQQKDELDDLLDDLDDKPASKPAPKPVAAPAPKKDDLDDLLDDLDNEKPKEQPKPAPKDDLDDLLDDLDNKKKPAPKPAKKDELDDLLDDIGPAAPKRNDAVPMQAYSVSDSNICAECGRGLGGQRVTALGKNYHPDCFVCKGCKTPLGTRPFHPVDNDPYCDQCFMLKYCKICDRCKKPITDSVITALGKTYHKSCFTCKGCNEPFPTASFYQRDNEPYCEKCFRELCAPKCGGCGRPITGPSLIALDKKWHPECFVCSVCHCPFPRGQFYNLNGKPVCAEHYHSGQSGRAGDVCAKCGQGIVPGVSYIETMGKKYHHECFTCKFCLTPLDASSYRENGGNPYCSACYEKLFG